VYYNFDNLYIRSGKDIVRRESYTTRASTVMARRSVCGNATMIWNPESYKDSLTYTLCVTIGRSIVSWPLGCRGNGYV
jgi:hypothetical protein